MTFGLLTVLGAGVLTLATPCVLPMVPVYFALVAGAVLGFISSILGIIPCIGWILAMAATALVTPMILVVYSHLFGQVGGETAAVIEIPPAA